MTIAAKAQKFTTLVSPEQLAQHLHDPQWLIFDCRFALTRPESGRQAYAKAHIPGARYAHLDEDLCGPLSPTSGRHPLPDPRVLAEKLGHWGVDSDKQVVVTLKTVYAPYRGLFFGLIKKAAVKNCNDISEDFATSLPALVIQGDPDQLEQLLINLLRNAVDASLVTSGAVSIAWGLPTVVAPDPALANFSHSPALARSFSLSHASHAA
jgi:hypothetical protein